MEPGSDSSNAAAGVARRPGGEKAKARLIHRTRLYLVLYALMVPTFAGMVVFNYYPKLETIRYSMYRWDGSTIEEFRWFKNFEYAFTSDPLFWQTFTVAGIILAAALFKMWPSIFTAVVIHRLRSERAQYVYRVLFVIPMVIPGLVWLLLWKSFYDPTTGIFNAILSGTGLMGGLKWLDTAMPALAASITPVRQAVVEPVFGSVWGLGWLGVLGVSLGGGLGKVRRIWILPLVSLGVLHVVCGPALFGASPGIWHLASACVIVLSLLAGAQRIRQFGLWWVILIAVGSFLWGPLRLLVILAVMLPAVHYLSGTFAGRDVVKWFTSLVLIVAAGLILTSMIWTEPTKAFEHGSAAWLGNTYLVLPALLFWGFPWVGIVGVLIYLAGLQNISQDVYEAAELDGVGAFGKLFKIELPLIMGQIRINLIFMTIASLQGYGLILLLFGPHGGPGNRALVPGLYMYREAFLNSRFGYACSLGMVLFVMILTLTMFYQMYLRVEK